MHPHPRSHASPADELLQIWLPKYPSRTSLSTLSVPATSSRAQLARGTASGSGSHKSRTNTNSLSWIAKSQILVVLSSCLAASLVPPALTHTPEGKKKARKLRALPPPSPIPPPPLLLKCDVAIHPNPIASSLVPPLHSSPLLLGQCPSIPGHHSTSSAIHPHAAAAASARCRRLLLLLHSSDRVSFCVSCRPSYGLRRGGWTRIVGRRAAVAAPKQKQAGDLDPRHHHRAPHGGDGGGGEGGGGGGGGGGGAQQEADEQQRHHHHRLLQLHQQVQQDQDPPPVPLFQLQHLQAAAAVRQRGGLSAEYALLAPMGDAGQSHSHHHHHAFQPQLLSFGGVGQHHVHQFTAQAQAPAASHSSRPRGGGGAGGEVVAATSASHSRVRGGQAGGGEIVAVQGGHIVRSTGRKDRHSKVCTARGPRDRRVRLSAHTAIQFYDVQDRLGYDRPSKAVDWLIKNAKDAIDKLETLPAWQPTATAANAAAPPSSSTHPDSTENSDDQAQAITVAHTAFDFPGAGGAGGGGSGAGFLPASLDSDSIADTIKSFFPMAGTGGGEASSSTAAAQSSAMGFQSYTPDLLSRTGSHSQELRLSLQSLPDPMFHHQHQDRSQQGHGGNGSAQQALFPGAASYSFGGGGGAMWAEQAQSQRMVPWNVPDPGGGGSTGGYLFNMSQQAAHMQAALGGQSQFFFQRGPLQSSNQPSERGWPETVEADNPMQQQHGGGLSPTVSAIGFAPGVGFSGIRIPTRIQGDEEHNGGSGNGDKPPPSVSSASHH